MKTIALAFIFLAFTACNRGWAQRDRDTLINSCVEKAQGTPGVDLEKLKKYCGCYQQNLEQKYATMGALSKASPEDITNEAQACLPLMVQ